MNQYDNIYQFYDFVINSLVLGVNSSIHEHISYLEDHFQKNDCDLFFHNKKILPDDYNQKIINLSEGENHLHRLSIARFYFWLNAQSPIFESLSFKYIGTYISLYHVDGYFEEKKILFNNSIKCSFWINESSILLIDPKMLIKPCVHKFSFPSILEFLFKTSIYLLDCLPFLSEIFHKVTFRYNAKRKRYEYQRKSLSREYRKSIMITEALEMFISIKSRYKRYEISKEDGTSSHTLLYYLVLFFSPACMSEKKLQRLSNLGKTQTQATCGYTHMHILVKNLMNKVLKKFILRLFWGEYEGVDFEQYEDLVKSFFCGTLLGQELDHILSLIGVNNRDQEIS